MSTTTTHEDIRKDNHDMLTSLDTQLSRLEIPANISKLNRLHKKLHDRIALLAAAADGSNNDPILTLKSANKLLVVYEESIVKCQQEQEILSTALAVFESSTSTTTTSANPLKRTTTDSTASTTTAAAAAAVDSTLADGTQRKRTKIADDLHDPLPPPPPSSNSPSRTTPVSLPSSSSEHHHHPLGGANHVAPFVLPQGTRVAVKPANDWILAIIIKYITNTNRYEVEDAEDDDEANPGQRKHYFFAPKQVIPIIPKTTTNANLLAMAKKRKELAPRSKAIALYPNSSCFYSAVIVTNPSMNVNHPDTKGYYTVKFHDDEDVERSISAEMVLDPPPKQ